MQSHIKFADVGIINGAIYINGFKLTDPYLYGIESQINDIIEQNKNPLDFGTIMCPEYKIPDVSMTIVVQPCPGIYNTYDWHGLSADLCGVTIDELEPHEFLKRVAYVLKCIGYVSHMDSTESEFAASEIMGQLKTLFDKKEVDHATDHMKTILELMAQLENVVMF